MWVMDADSLFAKDQCVQIVDTMWVVDADFMLCLVLLLSNSRHHVGGGCKLILRQGQLRPNSRHHVGGGYRFELLPGSLLLNSRHNLGVGCRFKLSQVHRNRFDIFCRTAEHQQQLAWFPSRLACQHCKHSFMSSPERSSHAVGNSADPNIHVVADVL